MPAGYTGVNSDAQDQAVKVGNPMVFNMPAPSSYGPTSRTYTANDILNGIIIHDGTNNVTATLPTAAALAAAIPGCRPGDTVECLIINGAGTAGTITLAGNTGVTFDINQALGSRIIGFASSKFVLLRFTNAAPGLEAYTVYS